MAIDEWLLDGAVARASGGAALRFYRWRRPTLSLGFHQRRVEPHWRSLAACGVIDLVRRPSGGQAVLHAGDLTYALVWPSPPGRRAEAYAMACRWLREGFAELGLPLAYGTQGAGAGNGNCFATATAADLVHGGGAKRIGSAQLWRRGRLLQHGSILLDPPTDLWRQVFGVDPPVVPALPLGQEDLILRLKQAAMRWLPLAAGPDLQGSRDLTLKEHPLSRGEWADIATRLERYRPEPLPEVETSPEATMDWATWPRDMPKG
jgi:lipoate-protein ligase A